MIGEGLRTILDTQNITMEMLSLQSGVPLETIRNLFYHKAENPRLKTVLSLSRALNVPIEALLPPTIPSTERLDEQQLISDYRQCSSHGKHLICFIASLEADMTHHGHKQQYSVPYFIPTNTAVSGNIYTACDVRSLNVNCLEAFAAICIPNNAHAPEYYQGDILLLANRFPMSGEHAVFSYEGCIHLRKFIISPNEEYILTAIHGRGADIRLKKSDKWTLMGTCIGIMREHS